MIIYFFVIVGAAVLGFSPFVVAVPRFMKQPSITEVGAYAGWTDVGDRYRMTRTVLGATAYSPLGSAEGDRFGVEFGVAYRQTEDIWYCDYVCIDEYEVDDGETLKGFIEASVLNRWNVAASDGADLYLLAGPSLATQATCLRRNHTLGTEEACTTRETDVRLVVGTRLAFQVSRRLDASASLRYGVSPWMFMPVVTTDADFDLLATTLSLGAVYRLGAAR